MRALVVYESMFGNNRRVAQAIAYGLGAEVSVETVAVGDAPTSLPADLDLLVVGGPNHRFGMSRPSSRLEARKEADGPWATPDIGLREWLEAVEPATAAVHYAVFDTRIDHPVVRRIDRAATTTGRRLSRHRLRQLTTSASFYVRDVRGPLVDGELQRAVSWGESLARALLGVPA